jgi:uncharacterized protein
MAVKTPITVYKRDYQGRFLLRYDGVLLEQSPTWLNLEARFVRDDVATDYVTFRRGDRMVEWFFTDRWYNIFELHNMEDDRLKGWYCNITRPAKFVYQNGIVSAVTSDDLALDVFVSPDGKLRILDEEEFESLDLSRYEQKAARDAVTHLQKIVKERVLPFDKIVSAI